MQKVKYYLSRMTILAVMVLLSLSSQSCDEPKEVKSPVGNWLRTEYYSVWSDGIDTSSSSSPVVYIEITDSTFKYYSVSEGIWGGVGVTPYSCTIEGDRITTYNIFDDSIRVGLRELQYLYDGDNLLLQSLTYPENDGDYRMVLEPYKHDLPPELAF